RIGASTDRRFLATGYSNTTQKVFRRVRSVGGVQSLT
ncbi:hypothetical protein GBAR_LOCUS28937, partial [Geodia barretti]